MRRRWSDRSSRRVRTLVTQLARSRLVAESRRMRADIHDGPEQTLQSEAGYSNARPHQPGRRNLLHRTAGPYSWVNSADFVMSALRPLMLQERRQSGHRRTSHLCQLPTFCRRGAVLPDEQPQPDDSSYPTQHASCVERRDSTQQWRTSRRSLRYTTPRQTSRAEATGRPTWPPGTYWRSRRPQTSRTRSPSSVMLNRMKSTGMPNR
jgi:hypothetical protein